MVTFSEAFEIIRNDTSKGMRLPLWNTDVYIKIRIPENELMTAPYLYVNSRYGRVPWKETMIELFSNEWEIVS
jgi:hypothetical protein